MFGQKVVRDCIVVGLLNKPDPIGVMRCKFSGCAAVAKYFVTKISKMVPALSQNRILCRTTARSMKVGQDAPYQTVHRLYHPPNCLSSVNPESRVCRLLWFTEKCICVAEYVREIANAG